MSDTIQPQQGYTRAGNPMAVAGFVCSLCGLIPWLGLIAAVCGIVFSALGLSKAKTTGNGKGLAIAGLIIGIVLTLPALIIIIAALSG
jgi:hypothetical protein